MSGASDFGSKALQVVSTVAPLLATALGGPLAGVAVKALEGVFGGPGAATDAALLNATPDQLAALKKADDDFQVQMKALGVQEEQLAYADTASARAREISVHDWIPGVLAIGLSLGFFGILSDMLVIGIHASDTGGEALLVMLGALGTAWTQVISYYFGSSAGSRRQSETIAQIAKQPGTNGKH